MSDDSSRATGFSPRTWRSSAQIESVELALCELFLSQLENDPGRLPPRLQKARKRMDRPREKEPATVEAPGMICTHLE
jgi:hypothetical protein